MAIKREPQRIWTIPGVPESTRPPVRVGDNLWDANSHDEYERRIKAVSEPDGSIEDRDFMLALGMTADQLLDSTGLTDVEIMAEFGQTREALAAALGLPTEEEVIEFGKRFSVPDAIHD